MPAVEFVVDVFFIFTHVFFNTRVPVGDQGLDGHLLAFDYS